MTTPRLSVKNCANWVYIYSGDPDTNQFISNILGSRTVQYKTYSGKLSEELSENRAYKGKQLKTPTELAVLQEGDTIVKHHRMYPIESNFKFFYKLNLGTAELDDIAFLREEKLSSRSLYRLIYLYLKKPFRRIICPKRTIVMMVCTSNQQQLSRTDLLDSPDSVVIYSTESRS
ncbi:type IV secretory system conjugative DNA transfer family protein [Ruminococcus sp.]|uniref:type IV secretory system conjugative DNA transfer family protein n=1 Tax=Ruminococcus sp. TaxID=41978 RepID=UPI00399EF45E